MFCKNCGKELTEDTIFCPACGTKQEKSTEQEAALLSSRKNAEIDAGNIFSKVWNSPLFTKAAIKFGNVLEILEGIICLILSKALFSEHGFWGNVFGILFVLAGILICISGIMPLLSRKKNQQETEALDEAAIRRKKKNFCIGIVIIVAVLIIYVNTGGGTYAFIKSATFDGEKMSIGEIIDENIKAPEWSQKELDNNTRLVYVEGYCPSYSETIKIEFYCEKLDDGSYSVSLNKMYFPDSYEEFNSFESAFVWASFYN